MRDAVMMTLNAEQTLDVICLARNARIKAEYGFEAMDELLSLLLKTEE